MYGGGNFEPSHFFFDKGTDSDPDTQDRQFRS